MPDPPTDATTITTGTLRTYLRNMGPSWVAGAIDADDDDEGIRVIGDWIVERICERGKLPGSRDVRRQAATFCRTNGYEIRTDEWLGV